MFTIWIGLLMLFSLFITVKLMYLIMDTQLLPVALVLTNQKTHIWSQLLYFHNNALKLFLKSSIPVW